MKRGKARRVPPTEVFGPYCRPCGERIMGADQVDAAATVAAEQPGEP